FDSRYLPEACATIVLPCFWVRRRYLYMYGEMDEWGNNLGISEGEGPDCRVLLPIHPAELHRYREFLTRVRATDASLDGIRILATPTSSTRTMLAWLEGRPNSAFFAKLTLQSKIL